MIKKINGVCYRNMIDYGIRNLKKHCKHINKLNVFPVPDGDTGTNMFVTMKRGLNAVGESLTDLSAASQKFAKTVIFEARGNSGVILSQFLKGFSESFSTVDEADPLLFIKALENGVKCAYSAVSSPVEGTMLTVLREATEKVKTTYNGSHSINEIVDIFVESAKESLEKTPDLLPELKNAGVVDSGGAGIVYLFEGIKKYFDGEEIESATDEERSSIDYSAFNEESIFEFGYCTELLIQLLKNKSAFSYKDFRKKLEKFGTSMVTSFEDGKVRVHIHTLYPEAVISFCHEFGEFLNVKIENMTVQHSGNVDNILCSNQKEFGAFCVVAVAFDRATQKLLIEMGADAVIFCEESASAKDYIDAFEKLGVEEGKEIIVFPNSNDAILSAIQAKRIYKKNKITVISSKSFAECYASLPAIDFEESNVDKVVDGILETINNLCVVFVVGRSNPLYDGEKRIERTEYYSFSGKEIISIKNNLVEVALYTILDVVKKNDKEIITIFYGENVSQTELGELTDGIKKSGICAEVYTIPVDTISAEMVVSFE